MSSLPVADSLIFNVWRTRALPLPPQGGDPRVLKFMKKQSRKMINRAQSDTTQEKHEEIAGFIKKLIRKGNLRYIVIRKPSGQAFMEMSLTAGVAVGGIFLLFAPRLLALLALVALLRQVGVDIMRSDSSE